VALSSAKKSLALGKELLRVQQSAKKVFNFKKIGKEKTA